MNSVNKLNIDTTGQNEKLKNARKKANITYYLKKREKERNDSECKIKYCNYCQKKLRTNCKFKAPATYGHMHRTCFNIKVEKEHEENEKKKKTFKDNCLLIDSDSSE